MHAHKWIFIWHCNIYIDDRLFLVILFKFIVMDVWSNLMVYGVMHSCYALFDSKLALGLPTSIW